MIDSHCHLTDPRLRNQLDAVISRAAEAGVPRMITIGTDPPDWEAAIELCRGRDSVRCALGVHPNHCGQVEFEQVARLRELQHEPSVLAVGEMGLDYHHHFADRARQRKFFEVQLAMAVELSRPVVIHCREAVDDALAVMKGFPGTRAVFHCFTGSVAEAASILNAGYLLGFTGVVTFKRSDDLREAVRRTPHERLLVETDAPYLSPEPHRSQKINEPALVVYTARVVAQEWGVDLDEVDRITLENAAKLFGWNRPPISS